MRYVLGWVVAVGACWGLVGEALAQQAPDCTLALTLQGPEAPVHPGQAVSIMARFAVIGSGPIMFVRPLCTGSASLGWSVTDVNTGRRVPQSSERCDYTPPPRPGSTFEMWGGETLEVRDAVSIFAPPEPGRYEVVATYVNDPARTEARWLGALLVMPGLPLDPGLREGAHGEVERMEASAPCRLVSAPVTITVSPGD